MPPYGMLSSITSGMSFSICSGFKRAKKGYSRSASTEIIVASLFLPIYPALRNDSGMGFMKTRAGLDWVKIQCGKTLDILERPCYTRA
jgi:hypothetical protein